MGTRPVCSEACKAACKAESVARSKRARPPSPPGLGERPTRRHLVAAAESARALQPPVESEPAAESARALQPPVESEPAARGPSDEGQRGPMPSLARDAPAAPPVPREAPVGLCPPDDVIRQRLVERQLAKLQRDFRRGDAIQADLARAGVHTSDVKGQVNGLVRWTATDGRSGPKPPSDSEIYDMVLACERAKHTGASSQMIRPMVAEMTISGVVTENRDRSGRAHPHGALRWCCVDG